MPPNSFVPMIGKDADGPATAVEIRQQPELWKLVAAEAKRRRAATDDFLRPLLSDRRPRIVLSGAGTSAFAGQVLAPALTARLRRRVDAVATTDIVSSPRAVFGEDVPTLLVSLARSGDSPESTAATAVADELLSSVRHLVITCNSHGQLARAHSDRADSLVLLMPAAANDRGFAMTSSFTSMLLAAQLALDPDGSDGSDGSGGSDGGYVDRLGAAAGQLLAERAGQLAGLAARRYRRVVYLGSGALTGLAREAALKLLELTAGQVVSSWDSSLGFRHGPKAFLEQGTLCFVFVSADPYSRRYDEDIADELRHALGDEHVVEVSVHAGGGRPTWHIGDLGHLPDSLIALPYAVLAQQFALLASVECGLAPDNPFPSGELSRVVRGITIYSLPRQT
ncbi:MAG TPA: SIS domain-containing protein [Streptosporangiaceae bacterium]|nr:SIS domain-containing protein [Streptosporangiaceae bacterium]